MQLRVQDRFGAPSQCELARLEAMPVTSGGEVNREALRAMNEETAGAEREAPPGTEAERQIAGIWRDVLGGRQPGAHDSFFQLGGNSLSATQAISRIAELFQVRLEVRDMFEHGTVHKLAALVAQRQNQREPDPERGAVKITDIETLLMNVDQMSDDQVAELLGQMQHRMEE
jgi:hypothetical protein